MWFRGSLGSEVDCKHARMVSKSLVRRWLSTSVLAVIVNEHSLSAGQIAHDRQAGVLEAREEEQIQWPIWNLCSLLLPRRNA